MAVFIDRFLQIAEDRIGIDVMALLLDTIRLLEEQLDLVPLLEQGPTRRTLTNLRAFRDWLERMSLHDSYSE